MNEHFERVAALVAAMADGDEKVLRVMTYLQTTGKKNVEVTHREVLRRVSDNDLAHVITTTPKNQSPKHIERDRYDVRGLADATLFDSHLRKALGLPVPNSAEIFDRAVVRIGKGHCFVQSGADDGGGHSGRGISGGSLSLFAEGDMFVIEVIEFEGGYGQTPTETRHERTSLNEAALRERVFSDGSLQRLIGIGA